MRPCLFYLYSMYIIMQRPFFLDTVVYSIKIFFYSSLIFFYQVLPLLKQLHDHGNESSHHVYMLLIILLILSQDDCFNKSIHEKVGLILVTKVYFRPPLPPPHTLYTHTCIYIVHSMLASMSQVYIVRTKEGLNCCMYFKSTKLNVKYQNNVWIISLKSHKHMVLKPEET